MFGKDFFKIFHFIIELLRLMAGIWGDEDDQSGFENHLSKDRERLARAADASGKIGKTDT